MSVVAADLGDFVIDADEARGFARAFGDECGGIAGLFCAAFSASGSERGHGAKCQNP